MIDEEGVAVFVGVSWKEVDAGVDEDADGRVVEGFFGVGGGKGVGEVHWGGHIK